MNSILRYLKSPHVLFWSAYILLSGLLNKWKYPATPILPVLGLNFFLVISFYVLVSAFLRVDADPRDKRAWLLLCRDVLLLLLGAYALLELVFPLVGLRLERPGAKFTWMRFLREALIALFSFCAYALAYVYMKKAIRNEREKRILAETNLRQVEEKLELELLKQREEEEKRLYEMRWQSAQIYPHFLKNSFSLLQLRAVALDDPVLEQTTQSLTAIMAYALETSQAKSLLVTVEREITYLDYMLRLIRLQHADDAVVQWEQEGRYMGQQIPQFTLLTLIENALKYGDITAEYPLLVETVLSGTHFYFSCTNRKKPVTRSSGGGLGLANLQQRGYNLMQDNFELSVKESADFFTVKLTISYAN